MGNCHSDIETKGDRAIAKKNLADHNAEKHKAKLLLLGPGESGKSAIFKQARVLYGPKLTSEKLEYWKGVIQDNVVELVKELCTHDKTSESGVEKEKDIVMHMQKEPLSSRPRNDERTYGEVIRDLWRSETIQKLWAHRSEYQVVDSHQVFMDQIDRISDLRYTPTSQDTVLARVRTTGVSSDTFVIDGASFEIYDVGGQRSERRKWIHVFDRVTAILFVVGLSEYDQMCFEDGSQNRMLEAFELFKWISSHEVFMDTSIILFLNKSDLFADKVKRIPIESIPMWGDYQGEGFDMGCEYFSRRFTSINSNSMSSRQLYLHVTVATDPTNMRLVFNSVRDSVITKALITADLL